MVPPTKPLRVFSVTLPAAVVISLVCVSSTIIFMVESVHVTAGCWVTGFLPPSTRVCNVQDSPMDEMNGAMEAMVYPSDNRRFFSFFSSSMVSMTCRTVVGFPSTIIYLVYSSIVSIMSFILVISMSPVPIFVSSV